MAQNKSQFIVLKFGGTSVASKERWEVICSVARENVAKGLKPIIVCSAISGVSNTLEEIIQGIEKDKSYQEGFERLKKIHLALAKELLLEKKHFLEVDFVLLERILFGASLVQEVSPRLYARIMSFGEIFCSRLGADFLNSQGLKTAWIDAREHLIARQVSNHSISRQYLSAICSHEKDVELQHYFDVILEPVILTQGFIASNKENQTVLLGRGGSDTSASYFAAKLEAVRCEIWTDVPGMYTANPQQIPDARLLQQLDYEEAQEIASMGAKVLHPRCIAPLKPDIPLHIRCTWAPRVEGTVIAQSSTIKQAQIKSISTKNKVTLIAIEGLGMWHEVGFLAEVFTCFKNHGLSIDLISTSQTNVTVSIDPLTNVIHSSDLASLIGDLEQFGKVQVIAPCMVISLVGQNIRSILNQLGPLLDVFKDQKVYLVSQAASDLNLSFVVPESEALQLVQRLHNLLFSSCDEGLIFGPSWQETFLKNTQTPKQSIIPWWQQKKSTLIALSKKTSPLYVYDEETLKESVYKLKSLKSIDQIFYAIKANDNQDVLRTFFNESLSFECVSIGEIDRIFSLFPQLKPTRVLFTPNFAPKLEYERALSLGCRVTVDNLYLLQRWPKLFSGKKIFLRLDPGKGQGHHQHVQTAGEQSKFGVLPQEIDQVLKLAKQHQITIEGLHAHAGSGIFDPKHWSSIAMFLINIAQKIPSVCILDLGGGLAQSVRVGEIAFDLEQFDQSLLEVRLKYPQYQFWLEPGRYLVAQAGVLLTTVTQIKEKEVTQFIGVDAGMNSLLRPMLYGAYHPIVNLTRLEEIASIRANVVGPICESGDTLGYSRQLPPTCEGDVMLIAVAGAYGYVMGSHYNRRDLAKEFFLTCHALI